MFPQQEVLAKVTCYCCGYDGAEIIKDPLGNSPDGIIFNHTDCGQRATLSEYLIRLFYRQGITINQSSITGKSEKTINLNVNQYTAEKTYLNTQKILSQLGGFPLRIVIYLGGNLSKTVCPACGGQEFFRKGSSMICDKDGLIVSIENYFGAFLIENHYSDYLNQGDGVSTIGEKKFDIFTGNSQFCWVILRTNILDDQIIVVGSFQPKDSRYVSFKETIVKINDHLPQETKNRFRVVIAKED